MLEFVLTDVSPEIVLAAAASEDDVGIYLRSHHLVEQAAEKAADALYEKYDALRHDTLNRHLNALTARGADGPLFRAARIVAKHRRDFAHTRAFVVSEPHVAEVQREIDMTDAERLYVPIKGKLVLYNELRPAHRYLVLCVALAASIELAGKEFRKLRDSTDALHVSTRLGDPDGTPSGR